MQPNAPIEAKDSASRPTGIVQTISGPSERATAIVEDADHEHEQGLALFAIHGLADGATTLFATTAIDGGAGEGNPIMAGLLHSDPVIATGVMLAVVAAISIVYPRLARVNGFHPAFGTALAVIGLLVAINNMVIVGVLHV